MPVNLEVIEGNYLSDLVDQPRALKDTLPALDRSEQLLGITRRFNRGKFQRILLTGMGSSFHALHPICLQLVNHGFTAIMTETSELVRYQTPLLDPKTLVIAVSQSGQSAEMVRLAAVNRKRSVVIAVTNTPGSALGRHATAVLQTRAGSESTVSCKTYVASLMALKWLGDTLCEVDARRSRRELAKAAPAVTAYLSRWKEHVALLAQKLTGIRHLFFVGRGASLAAVGTAGLIVKEADHFHAEGMSSAAFRHGPMEMLSRETMVAVFAGERKTRDLNERLVEDVRRSGGCAEIIGEGAPVECLRLADCGNSVRPILEILPVQMMTLALAALAGREAGKFELATKITTTE